VPGGRREPKAPKNARRVGPPNDRQRRPPVNELAGGVKKLPHQVFALLLRVTVALTSESGSADGR